jgi:2-phosphosulfolactate phosphatase
MQVEVIPSVNESTADDFINKTVIVIDVLRATSSIVTALEQNSIGVIPVKTVGQAKDLCQENDLLGGERFCKKISGFHLGNSPIELIHTDVQGKRIILTTTNGTRAIDKAQKAAHVLAGAMLNASACAAAALNLKRDIVIVCAGTMDRFSLEDGVCAGLIIDELAGKEENLDLSDFAKAMRYAYSQVKDRLQETILESDNGRRLRKLGFAEDVFFCTRVNMYTKVPILRNHILEPFQF